MLSQGLAALRHKGVQRAILFVDADNENAQRLYGSFGFTVEREDQMLRFSRS
jgi:ribosomal protein S18 acetylase RimI-like enzyme